MNTPIALARSRSGNQQRDEVDDAGEEAGLADAEQDPRDDQRGPVPDEGGRRRHDAPADHDASHPHAGADAVEHEIARNLEDHVGGEEDPRARPKSVAESARSLRNAVSANVMSRGRRTRSRASSTRIGSSRRGTRGRPPCAPGRPRLGPGPVVEVSSAVGEQPAAAPAAWRRRGHPSPGRRARAAVRRRRAQEHLELVDEPGPDRLRRRGRARRRRARSGRPSAGGPPPGRTPLDARPRAGDVSSVVE